MPTKKKIVPAPPPGRTASNGIAGYAEFELDLIKALRQDLPPVVDAVSAASLTRNNVSALPEKAQGVYLLLENGKPTYVGKTDARHGFRERLTRHFLTLSARKNIDLAKISFKAVRIMVFTVINVETTLIELYTKDNPSSWQNTGFGSNDPGHNREKQASSAFDKCHPINIDLRLDSIKRGHYCSKDLLVTLKDSLPFDFRYETDAGPKSKPVKYTVGHADQRATHVVVPHDSMTLRELLKDVLLPAFPDGWVATVFPGRVILYKEPDIYPEQIEQLTKP
jgi:hypothetical protein